MLKTLLRKQMMEIFRSWFCDPKTGKKRPLHKVILLCLGYGVLLVGVLGAFSVTLAISACEPLHYLELDWLYFLLIGLVSLVLGAFGSVLHTYAGLYLSKDNDLLLSMPIPAGTILTARLLGVYLMGLLYTAVMFLPAAVVYDLRIGAGVGAIISQLWMVLLLSLLVLVLACLLGWVVARVSVKLRNRSYVTVLISLCFLALYYAGYYRAQQWLNALLQNAVVYGGAIRSGASPLYLLGRMGQGDPLALLFWTLITAALLALCWVLLSRSFLRLATASGERAQRKGPVREQRSRSLLGALLHKELGRFTSSANYMLNCGLGTVLLPTAGILLLVKGGMVTAALESVFGAREGCTPVLLCAGLCLLGSMNDMVTPSVSLEGKSLWLLQSLPVPGKAVLQAKLLLQLLFTGVPMLFCAICMAVVWGELQVQLVLLPLLNVALLDVLGLTLGLSAPNLTWTNEVIPIKQSFSVLFALLLGFAYAVLLAVVYFAIGHQLGAGLYLWLACLVTALITAVLYRALMTRGVRRFAAL